VGHAGLVTQKCGKTAWLLVVIGRERFHCNRANQKLTASTTNLPLRKETIYL
jgi:hypothetical protein